METEMTLDTQNRIIRTWLEAGHTVTSYEAFIRWKITRLSARIYDLIHRDGLNIVGDMELNSSTNKRYKRYRLA